MPVLNVTKYIGINQSLDLQLLCGPSIHRCMSVRLSACLSVYLHFRPSVCLSACPSVCVCVCVCVRLCTEHLSPIRTGQCRTHPVLLLSAISHRGSAVVPHRPPPQRAAEIVHSLAAHASLLATVTAALARNGAGTR